MVIREGVTAIIDRFSAVEARFGYSKTLSQLSQIFPIRASVAAAVVLSF